MLFSSLVASALLATGAFAQYGYGDSYGSSDSSSAVVSATAAAVATGSSNPGAAPSGSVSVQVVKVSDNNGTLRFFPDDIKADAGTMVQFHFYPKNHSVVQSAFSNPCEPINNVTPNVTGFKSGFMPVAAGAATMPVFTLMVNDTSPVWFYCSQKPHCQKGMVGVINAPGGAKTIDTFRSLAEASSDNSTTTSSPTSGSSGSSGTSSSAPSAVTTNAAARLVSSASLVGVVIGAFAYLL